MQKGIVFLVMCLGCGLITDFSYATGGVVNPTAIVGESDEVVPVTNEGEYIEELMGTKELQGQIKEVGAGVITVSTDSRQEVELLIDAATLIYINDVKGLVGDIKPGDEIFAYYTEENGTVKCDWLEVSR